MSFKSVMQSRDLTRGLVCGVGMGFNCLRRDPFKKKNKKKEQTRYKSTSSWNKRSFCSLEVDFWREGRVLLLSFRVFPPFRDILECVNSSTVGWGSSWWDPGPGESWLSVHWHLEFHFPPEVLVLFHPCPGFPVSMVTLSPFSFSGAGIYKQFQDKIAAFLAPAKETVLVSCQLPAHF